MANVIDISGGMTPRTGLTAQELLARELLKGNRGPSYGVGDSLSRLASQLGGAYFAKQGEEQRAAKQTRGAQALMKAASTIGAGVPAWTNPDTGETMGNAVAPGMASLQAVMASNPDPSIARALPQLLQVAQAYEKEKPKAPEGMRFNAQGGLENIPGFADAKGQQTAAGWKPVDRLRAEAEAGWKPPEVVAAEAEARARAEAKFRAPLAAEPLVEIADPNSPTGTRYVQRSQAIGQPGKPPSGMRVTTNPDGTVSIEQGRQTGNKTEEKEYTERLVKAKESLVGLNDINTKFRPEYQQFGTRFATMKTAFMNKIGVQPSPEDAKLLSDFSEYKRSSIALVNRTINELTGAAVGVQEAGRLRAQIPDPGQGALDGDSPIEFKAKLDGVMGDVRAAVARYSYALNRKIDPTTIPLAQVPTLMAERENQLVREVELTHPSADEATRRETVKKRLSQEFGLN